MVRSSDSKLGSRDVCTFIWRTVWYNEVLGIEPGPSGLRHTLPFYTIARLVIIF